MKVYAILFSLVLIGIGCQPSQNNIGDYQDIREVFEDDEIKDLEKIIDFFNEAICKSENLDDNDILECYEQYFQRMHKSAETGNVEIQIAHQEQEDLIKSLNPNLFNQIWLSGKTWRKNSDTLDVYNIRNDGKYVEFLKEYGKVNNKAKDYGERIELLSDISPGLFADILLNYKEYDVRDERMKLLIAIHYLTKNEQYITEKTFKYKDKN